MCGGAVRRLLCAQLPHWGAGAGLEGQGGAAGGWWGGGGGSRKEDCQAGGRSETLKPEGVWKVDCGRGKASLLSVVTAPEENEVIAGHIWKFTEAAIRTALWGLG